jgi:hypothetical protein
MSIEKTNADAADAMGGAVKHLRTATTADLPTIATPSSDVQRNRFSR